MNDAEAEIKRAEELVRLRKGLEILGNNVQHLREELDHLTLDMIVLLNHLRLKFEDVPAKPAERRLVQTVALNDLRGYACDRGGT